MHIESQNELRETLIGMSFMLVSTFCFAALTIAINHMPESMNSIEIVFWRNLFSVLILLPIIKLTNACELRTDYGKQHFSRALIGVAGMHLWFYALTVMPANEATALSFTAPLFTTIIAVIFLKEAIGKHRITALIVGFCGVLIILRPSVDAGMQPEALLILLATVLWGAAGVMVKSLSAKEPVIKIMFFMNLLMTVLTVPLMIPYFRLPTAEHVMPLAGVTFFGLVAHYYLVTAFSRVDVVKLMPLDFTRLIFTAILAYFILDETLDMWDGVGAAVIMVSSVYIAWREKVRKRQRDANLGLSGKK